METKETKKFMITIKIFFFFFFFGYLKFKRREGKLYGNWKQVEKESME